MPATYIALSTTKLIILSIGSFLMGALSIALALNVDNTFINIIGWLGTFFFCAAGVMLLRKRSDTKAGLILDEHGIHDNSSALAAGLVDWNHIKTIKTTWMNGQPLIVVEVHNPDTYINLGNIVSQKMRRANVTLVGSPVVINPTSLKYPLSELEHLIQRYFTHYRKE